LRRAHFKYGKAPHKPIMLLSVLQAIRSNIIIQNQISITPELVYLFKTNWNTLVTTEHVCNFALPFWHLNNEKPPFWNLVAKPGYEVFIKSQESVSSLGVLNTSIAYATLDADLFALMQNENSNRLLQQLLLDEYFKDTQNKLQRLEYKQDNLFDDVEGKILNETAEQYRTEIIELLAAKNEEEIFIRGGVFKREIPKIYNNTCCISGLRVEATANISMVDACHIIPFAESYDDTIQNGIALTPTLHRAFDRGLIGIDYNYRVIVSSHFKETVVSYCIRQFEGKEILLPENPKYYPSLEGLRRQRKTII